VIAELHRRPKASAAKIRKGTESLRRFRIKKTSVNARYGLYALTYVFVQRMYSACNELRSMGVSTPALYSASPEFSVNPQENYFVSSISFSYFFQVNTENPLKQPTTASFHVLPSPTFTSLWKT
jgi:hypothetical protein